MGEESAALVHYTSDRAVEQAIISLKKGAHLLKYGRRGKPKLHPFRLSADENFLIWYSGQEEKQLRLNSVTNISCGKSTKQFRPEKESQCISLICANGERSIDLICKDKVQAESWFLGLRSVISRIDTKRTTITSKKQRGAQSCINSPVGFMRRKNILGLSEEKIRSYQVQTLSRSPPSSFSASCISDGLSSSSDSFYSESSLSSLHNVPFLARSPSVTQREGKNVVPVSVNTELFSPSVTRFHEQSKSEMHVLRDILIWGEGADDGCFVGEEAQSNVSLPRLLESTVMLDAREVSLGRKHAALITKQGEVYCWGEGKRGRLGHKLDMDTPCPKLIDSLVGISVSSVNCGEYQTCAVTLSGELYVWGDNYATESLPGEDNKSSHWLPHKLSGCLEGVQICNVSCGAWHTAILSKNGQLFTYGNGTFGVLGHGDLQSFSKPKEVESLKGLRVKAVSCGSWHTAAVIQNIVDDPGGKLFTWGDPDHGRLGHPDQETKVLPTFLQELRDCDFVQVSCSCTFTLGLTSAGKVYTIGRTANRSIGDSPDKSILAIRGRLLDEFVINISSGSCHIAVLTSKGNVYTWGKGENGQLGLGDTKDRNSPTLVTTLRDRKVEKITCGLNSTAAICFHKSVSSADQSACRGCGNAFSFTRKKHNCYNCGNLFCHACSSKRSVNASLAPLDNKPFRVCTECFNILFKFETNTPRSLLATPKIHPSDKEGIGDPGSKRSRVSSVRNYCDDGGRCSERNHVYIQVEKPDISSMFTKLPRWGQVSCPDIFTESCGYDSISGICLRYQLSSMSSYCLVDDVEKSKTTSTSDGQKYLYSSERFLSEEIRKLKAEADSLEKQCQSREDKIHEHRQKIEEAWSLAKEEATKCKAAKEIIQLLTSKLYAMSESFSYGQHAEDQSMPATRIHPIPCSSHSPPETMQIDDRNGENLCWTPSVSSVKLRSSNHLDPQAGIITSTNESGTGKIESGQTGTKLSKFEWVEQYQPGVYVALMTLSNGKTDMKRVRFSRKKFSESEAKRWWDENQQIVCLHYGIEGHSSSKRD